MHHLLLVAIVAGGCAHDVRARLPRATPDESTGSIELVLTHPAPDVYVAVNGVLVVDGANTSRIRIDGIATGYADVAIAMGAGEKQQQIWVEEGKVTVLPMGSAGGSPWDSIRSMAISLAGVALYALIRG